MQAVHLEKLQDVCMGKDGGTAWTVIQLQALEDAQRLLARCCLFQPCEWIHPLSEVPQAPVMCPPDFLALLPHPPWCHC